MEIDFGGFGEFTAKTDNLEIKKTKKYDRIWKVGKGGSICFHNAHENYIYYGSMDSYLYKVDCTTGEIIWTFKAGNSILCKPSEVFKGKIYFGSYDQRIYAVDFETGKEVWRFQTAGKIGTNHPVIYQGRVYIGTQDSFFYCLDAETGKLIWKFKTGDEIACTATVHEGKVFIGSFDGYYYCLNADSGNEIWRFKTGDNIQIDESSPLLNGMVFVTSFDNFLRALDVNTGAEVWRFKTGKYGNSSIPKILNGVLYMGTRDGFFYAISPEGKELWRFKTGGQVLGFGFHDNRIYITSEDAHVYCLSVQGENLWTYKSGGPLFDFPTFYDNKLFLGSWDCHMYAINLSTKKESWRLATSSLTPAPVPPQNESYEFEIKKSADIIDTVGSEEKYAGSMETLNLSEYGAKSEYASKSEYTHKSEYTTEFVIFEGCMNIGVAGMFIPQNTFNSIKEEISHGF